MPRELEPRTGFYNKDAGIRRIAYGDDLIMPGGKG